MELIPFICKYWINIQYTWIISYYYDYFPMYQKSVRQAYKVSKK